MNKKRMEKQIKIGLKLKHALENKGLRLMDLSNLVGCFESMLAKVENDKINPSL